MGREIELKLTIDRADVDSFIHHPFICSHLSGTITRKRLVSRYFDTPDQRLRVHLMALRVRWDGDAYIQTLKHKGQSRNGLTDRKEWEWPLEGPGPDMTLVPTDFWPSDIRSQLDALVPLFETDFQRTLWPIAIPPGSLPNTRISARVEIALDQGEIHAAVGSSASREEILEVELELMEGDSGILHSIWERLKGEIRLKPSDMSKAERGYRMFAHKV